MDVIILDSLQICERKNSYGLVILQNGRKN